MASSRQNNGRMCIGSPVQAAQPIWHLHQPVAGGVPTGPNERPPARPARLYQQRYHRFSPAAGNGPWEFGTGLRHGRSPEWHVSVSHGRWVPSARSVTTSECRINNQ